MWPPVIQQASTCREPTRLPTVPVQEPRPGEGAVADQQWQFRPDPPLAPTASLIDMVKGNDAVIQVIVGQGRLLTLKADLANEMGEGVVSVGDPTILEFDLVQSRLIRLLGNRAGVTDLSITTAEGQTYAFEVHVVYDLELLRVQLQQVFPDAHLRLFQIREHLAVEGQARSVRQVDQILRTIQAYLTSMQVASTVKARRQAAGEGDPTAPDPRRREGTIEGLPQDVVVPRAPRLPGEVPIPGQDDPSSTVVTVFGAGSNVDIEATFAPAQIINLLRVPGVQQVMLQVRIAEVNRTGLREIGSNIFFQDSSGTTLGTNISTAGSYGAGSLGPLLLGGGETVFGVFPSANLTMMLQALRRNNLATILAEPNLVAMSGQHASFLAGGEFPVPIPQASGGGTTITVEFKKFGVQLDFLPFVLEDEMIRLTVTPEVSSIDAALGTVIEGFAVPGLNTRRAETTVEMRPGQTLAIAGLLQVNLDAQTTRIPGLGDLPYIGPLFSNTTHRRIEKELLVLVTPHMVAPMNEQQVPCLPGQELKDPNDLEFYLMNRIEARTGRDIPSTRTWDDPWGLVHLMHLERNYVYGPAGYSSCEY